MALRSSTPSAKWLSIKELIDGLKVSCRSVARYPVMYVSGLAWLCLGRLWLICVSVTHLSLRLVLSGDCEGDFELNDFAVARATTHEMPSLRSGRRRLVTVFTDRNVARGHLRSKTQIRVENLSCSLERRDRMNPFHPNI